MPLQIQSDFSNDSIDLVIELYSKQRHREVIILIIKYLYLYEWNEI